MLAIEHLSHRYAQAPGAALDDVSLRAERGSILGLLGPNGAGKSTLIAHLAGWLAPQQGSIRVDGIALAEVRRRQPTRIGIAPQDFAFYPTLSTTENLTVFAAAAGLRGPHKRARIEACLATAQLQGFAAVRAEHLSGGLKRRLNLAISLLAEPELLLVDEPTAGVDPSSRAFLLDSIRALARQGTAVIYTSHYLEEIEAIADRVLILDHGRVLRSGTLNELLSTDASQLSLVVEGLPGVALQALLAPFGSASSAGSDTSPSATPRQEIHLQLKPGTRPAAVLAALDAAGVQLHHAEFGRSHLAQIFLSLTEPGPRDH
jgi:ABC-2 type transport system ATP-binding protein